MLGQAWSWVQATMAERVQEKKARSHEEALPWRIWLGGRITPLQAWQERGKGRPTWKAHGQERSWRKKPKKPWRRMNEGGRVLCRWEGHFPTSLISPKVRRIPIFYGRFQVKRRRVHSRNKWPRKWEKNSTCTRSPRINLESRL